MCCLLYTSGLNLPARVRSGEVVAALSAWTDEVSENLFAVSAAPRETDGPAATPAPPEEAGFVTVSYTHLD